MLARMNRHPAPWLLAAALLTLSACSTVVVEPAAGQGGGQGGGYAAPAAARTPIPGGSYEVAKGDTLYSIAFRKGVDFRDLAKWNGIAAPYTIWPGQLLTLHEPAGRRRPAPPPVVRREVPAPVVHVPPVTSPVPTVAQTPVPAEDLERAKTQLIAESVYARDSQSTMARWYGAAITVGLTVASIQSWPDRIRAVTAQQVSDAARKWLDKKRSATGYLIKEAPSREEKRS